MVNASKIKDNRIWKVWKASGAVATLDDAVRRCKKLESKNKYISNLRTQSSLTETEIQDLADFEYKRVTGLKTQLRWFYLKRKATDPSAAEQIRKQAFSLLEAGIHTEHAVIDLCLAIEKYGLSIKLRMGRDLYSVDNGLVYCNNHLTLESQIQRSYLKLKTTKPEIAETMIKETGVLLARGLRTSKEAVAIGLLLADYLVATGYNYKVGKSSYQVSEGTVLEDNHPVLMSQIRKYYAVLKSHGRTSLIEPMRQELEPMVNRDNLTDSDMEQVCLALNKYISGFVLFYDNKRYSFSRGKVDSWASSTSGPSISKTI